MSNQDITNPADKIRKEEKYSIPSLPLPYDLETKEVLRQLNRANRKLAELKGVAQTIPNERILISSLTLQEAKDSSEVENIVTTQFTTQAPASETGNNIFHPCATDSPENSYLCSGK